MDKGRACLPVVEAGLGKLELAEAGRSNGGFGLFEAELWRSIEGLELTDAGRVGKPVVI